MSWNVLFSSTFKNSQTILFQTNSFKKAKCQPWYLQKTKTKEDLFTFKNLFYCHFSHANVFCFAISECSEKSKTFFSNFPTFTFIAFLFHLFSRETVLFLSNCYRFPIGSNKRNTIPIIEMPILFVFLFFYYREGCKNLLKLVNVYFAFYFRILRKFVTKSKT